MTITTGKPEWLKQVEEQRSPVSLNGITYHERNFGTRQCLIVRDYADITDCAADFNELLCVSSDYAPVFIDLGDAPANHDLIINAENGKVYVNGYGFNHIAGIQSLGDGSWGVVFQENPSKCRKGIVCWLFSLYESWLDEVYKKCGHLGLVEINKLHAKSIKHLIWDDLPKGAIISLVSSN